MVRGSSAFVHCPEFIARIDLTSGTRWVIERPRVIISEFTSRQPRFIRKFNGTIWSDAASQLAAELVSTECGAMRLIARHAATGELSWERMVPIPEAAEWAEREPAWPGAQTEEIIVTGSTGPPAPRGLGFASG